MTRETEFWRHVGELEDPAPHVCSEPEPAFTDACLAVIVAGLSPKPGERILEIGCGTGRLLLPLAERYPETTFVGLDVSPGLLDRLPPRINIESVFGDGETLPFPDESFDAIYSVAVFPIAVVSGLIRAAARVLVPGGRFLFQFVEGEQAAFLGHHFRIETVSEWCAVAGLAPLSIERGRLHSEWMWILATKPEREVTD